MGKCRHFAIKLLNLGTGTVLDSVAEPVCVYRLRFFAGSGQMSRLRNTGCRVDSVADPFYFNPDLAQCFKNSITNTTGTGN